MNKYRITFYGDKDIHKKVDIDAENSDDAFSIAVKMPEAKNRRYHSVSCQKIPEEASVIGIQFRYVDTVTNKRFSNYLFIKALSEKDAVDYYNRRYKGKSFWFNPGKIETNGKHIYGEVIETYFAACPRYDADATGEWI